MHKDKTQNDMLKKHNTFAEVDLFAWLSTEV